MKVSLVIPAYNEEKFIGSCLDSVIKNSHGKLAEIIVVDNASVDATADIARTKPGVAVIYEARKGTGNARQSGAEVATGDLIAYIDADTTLPDGWLERASTIFEKDTQVVFLSGPYKYIGSTRYPDWFLNSIWLVFATPVYWMVGFMGNGGNCVVRRDALMAIGGNDRSIAFYGDDTDLARRLHKVGKTIWRNDFRMNTSARRYDEQGLFVFLTYVLNYWWPVFFHRPFSTGLHLNKTQVEGVKKSSS